MEEQGVADFQTCPVRVPMVAPWFLPEVNSCICLQDKESLLPLVARSLFSEYASSYKASLPVYTDGLNRQNLMWSWMQDSLS